MTDATTDGMSGTRGVSPKLRIAEAVMDCDAHEHVLAFWAAALGYERGWSTEQFAQLHDPAGHGLTLLFQRVAEPKVGKNRVHLDLSAPDMAAEVARLAELGGHVVREVAEMGAHWTVMADPAGNEFCVVAAG